MPRTHPAIDVIWQQSDTVRRGYWLKLWLAAGLALAIFGGGETRVSAPGFATIRILGSWPVLSGTLAALAAALFVARWLGPRWVRDVYWAGAGLYAVMSVAFLVAAVQSPVTALTGPVAYMFIAAAHVSQTFAYRRQESRP